MSDHTEAVTEARDWLDALNYDYFDATGPVIRAAWLMFDLLAAYDGQRDKLVELSRHFEDLAAAVERVRAEVGTWEGISPADTERRGEVLAALDGPTEDTGSGDPEPTEGAG